MRPTPSPLLSHINVGTGRDVSIGALAQMVADVTGFQRQPGVRHLKARWHDAQADGCVPSNRYGVARADRPEGRVAGNLQLVLAPRNHSILGRYIFVSIKLE